MPPNPNLPSSMLEVLDRLIAQHQQDRKAAQRSERIVLLLIALVTLTYLALLTTPIWLPTHR